MNIADAKTKKRIYDAARYANNSVKMKAAINARRSLNRIKDRATKARYRANNKEKIRIQNALYGKAFRAAHPELVSAQRHLRRARKAKATMGDTKAITAWEKAWRGKPKVRCYWCFKMVAGKTAHADHIQPLSKGGAHALENLCISCPPCNQRKNAKTLDKWNETLSQPSLL